jgi:hypothetical protein
MMGDLVESDVVVHPRATVMGLSMNAFKSSVSREFSRSTDEGKLLV